jgi:transcriptional regulator with XRE-family HTH domain
MLSSAFGTTLRAAREGQDLSRAELAKRGGVSVRLLAELERGERPNVSLETALRLLNLVGLSIAAIPRAGRVSEPQSGWLDGTRSARAERAAHRRETWTGRRVSREDSGEEPAAPKSISRRIESVAEVSRLAYAIARAARRKKPAKVKRKPHK